MANLVVISRKLLKEQDHLDFRQKLVDIPPRDQSGARSSDRFVYQQSWALCRLIALHQGSQDYVLTFDLHEDVQEMDSEANPSTIKGFQIKTKQNGNWTIKAITKQEDGAGEEPTNLPSILGKLYTLKKQFPDETKLLQFVSNVPVSVKLKTTGKKSITEQYTRFEDLDEELQTDVRNSLKKELGLPEPPPLADLLEFQVSDIPLKNHDTYTKGKLTEFLQVLYPDRPFRIVPIYQSLLSEVAVRNNNQEPISSYEDLIRLKSISRKGFGDLLCTVGVSPTELKWETIENRLNTEGAPLALVQALRREWDGVSLARLSRTDIIQLRLGTMIAESCTNHQGTPKLIDFLESVYQEIAPKIEPTWAFSETYIRAAIVLEIYDSQ